MQQTGAVPMELSIEQMIEADDILDPVLSAPSVSVNAMTMTTTTSESVSKRKRQDDKGYIRDLCFHLLCSLSLLSHTIMVSLMLFSIGKEKKRQKRDDKKKDKKEKKDSKPSATLDFSSLSKHKVTELRDFCREKGITVR